MLKKIAVSFLPVIAVAALGSLFVFIGKDWFNALDKPGQWISSAIFPIVWTVIYIITGAVIYLWKDGMSGRAFVLFIINGALNVLWCLLFFTLRLTFVGLGAIIINLIAGWALLAEIKKHSEQYFYALLIYPVWLSLATALNAAVWILN